LLIRFQDPASGAISELLPTSLPSSDVIT
jgi:hypothetical protein